MAYDQTYSMSVEAAARVAEKAIRKGINIKVITYSKDERHIACQQGDRIEFEHLIGDAFMDMAEAGMTPG